MMSAAPFTTCPECGDTVDPTPCRDVTLVEWSPGEWTPGGFIPDGPLRESDSIDDVSRWYLACLSGRHKIPLPDDMFAQLLA